MTRVSTQLSTGHKFNFKSTVLPNLREKIIYLVIRRCKTHPLSQQSAVDPLHPNYHQTKDDDTRVFIMLGWGRGSNQSGLALPVKICE